MTLAIAADPLPLRIDEGGAYRVGLTRVQLDTVIFAYNAGSSAEQIAGDFPGLLLADVHAVIAYYLNHRIEVDAYLAEREQAALAMRVQLEAEGITPTNTATIKERLVARSGFTGKVLSCR